MHMDTKSTSIIGGVVLLIIAIGLALWYMSEHPAPFINTHTGQPQPGTTGGETPLSLDEDGKYYAVTAKYPGSTPLPPQASAKAVEVMKQFEINAIAAFKEQGNFNALTAEDIKMFGFDQGRIESLDIAYLTKTSPVSISYIFTMYQDTLGAHPNTYYRIFTWNTKTGAGLELDDLFSPGTDYLAILSKASREKLPALIAQKTGTNIRDVDMDYMKRGTTPDADNFTNWYLENGNLVLVFPPYQVGPYVIGTQEVPLPLSTLAGVRNDYK